MDQYFGKLLNLTLKRKELVTLLKHLGFKERSAKGSHVKFLKKGFPMILLSSHDKEVKEYQLKQVIKVFEAGGLLDNKLPEEK